MVTYHSPNGHKLVKHLVTFLYQPLENEVSDHQRQAISLNIEYKMSILEELKEDTGKLQGRAQSAVDDMNKVGD